MLALRPPRTVTSRRSSLSHDDGGEPPAPRCAEARGSVPARAARRPRQGGPAIFSLPLPRLGVGKRKRRDDGLNRL